MHPTYLWGHMCEFALIVIYSCMIYHDHHPNPDKYAPNTRRELKAALENKEQSTEGDGMHGLALAISLVATLTRF